MEILAILAVITYFGHKLLPVVDAKLKLEERKVAVQERQAAVAEHDTEIKEQVASRPIPKPEPPPEDIFRNAMLESEPWAREQALKRIWELHNDLGDWNKVRNTLLVTGG